MWACAAAASASAYRRLDDDAERARGGRPGGRGLRCGGSRRLRRRGCRSSDGYDRGRIQALFPACCRRRGSSRALECRARTEAARSPAQMRDRRCVLGPRSEVRRARSEVRCARPEAPAVLLSRHDSAAPAAPAEYAGQQVGAGATRRGTGVPRIDPRRRSTAASSPCGRARSMHGAWSARRWAASGRRSRRTRSSSTTRASCSSRARTPCFGVRC
jgi:hypothetical protein